MRYEKFQLYALDITKLMKVTSLLTSSCSNSLKYPNATANNAFPPSNNITSNILNAQSDGDNKTMLKYIVIKYQ